MGFEQPSTPSPEEMAEIKKERTLSEAELLEGGAEYKVDEEGKERLEVTDEQIEEAKEKMEMGEGIESKQEEIPTPEKTTQAVEILLENEENKLKNNKTIATAVKRTSLGVAGVSLAVSAIPFVAQALGYEVYREDVESIYATSSSIFLAGSMGTIYGHLLLKKAESRLEWLREKTKGLKGKSKETLPEKE